MGSALAVLGPHLARRRAAGAGPEDFLFVDQDGDHIDRHAVAYRWRVVAKALALPKGLTFYRATRHSLVSRSIATGVSLDEVANAVGHASTSTTLTHYMHHVRKRWSPVLHAGLGLDGAPGAKVIRLSPPSASAPIVEAVVRPTEPGEGGHDEA